jgi:hypothetical protein
MLPKLVVSGACKYVATLPMKARTQRGSHVRGGQTEGMRLSLRLLQRACTLHMAQLQGRRTVNFRTNLIAYSPGDLRPSSIQTPWRNSSVDKISFSRHD